MEHPIRPASGLCRGNPCIAVLLPAHTPSLRLMADQAAGVLAGVSHALHCAGPARRRSCPPGAAARWRPASRAPIFCRLASMRYARSSRSAWWSPIWIVTAWPNGAGAIAFATIGVIFRAARLDQAHAVAKKLSDRHLRGRRHRGDCQFCGAARPGGLHRNSASHWASCAGAGRHAGGPHPGRRQSFLAIAFLLVPLLAPANQMSYDPQQFYNSASAIVPGHGHRRGFVPAAAAAVAGISGPAGF